jgi:hypothetical protein
MAALLEDFDNVILVLREDLRKPVGLLDSVCKPAGVGRLDVCEESGI